MDLLVNFCAIFNKEGTDVEAVKKIFMEKGAKDVQVSYDYITLDDEPDTAVTFFVEGLPFGKLISTKLEMNLFTDPGLPDYHYVCREL